jgi:hypothetical protein
MKLSCQEQLLPGASLQAKFDFARRAGFAGIELRARGDGQFAARLPALQAASWGIFSQRLAPFTPPHQSREDRKVLLKALEVLSEHAARESV